MKRKEKKREKSIPVVRVEDTGRTDTWILSPLLLAPSYQGHIDSYRKKRKERSHTWRGTRWDHYRTHWSTGPAPHVWGRTHLSRYPFPFELRNLELLGPLGAPSALFHPPVPSISSLPLQLRFECPLVRSNRHRDVTEPNCRHIYERNESLSFLLSSPLPSLTFYTAPFRSLPCCSPSWIRSFLLYLLSPMLFTWSSFPDYLSSYLCPFSIVLFFSVPPSLFPSLVGLLVWPALLEHYRGIPVLLPGWFVLYRVASSTFSSRRHLVLLVLERSSGSCCEFAIFPHDVSYILLLFLPFYNRWPVNFSFYILSLTISADFSKIKFCSGLHRSLLFLLFFFFYFFSFSFFFFFFFPVNKKLQFLFSLLLF